MKVADTPSHAAEVADAGKGRTAANPLQLLRKMSVLPSYAGVAMQRVKMEPPEALKAVKLQGMTIVKKFGEGSHAYLIVYDGQQYVLKLSSEDAEAEVNTGLLAKMLGVPAAAGALLGYTEEQVDKLAQLVVGDREIVEGMQKKMRKQMNEGGGHAIVMEYVVGKSLSSHFELGEDKEVLQEGDGQIFLQKLQEKGMEAMFFTNLGQIAAFDIITANKDRFNIQDPEHSLYQGGLPNGNTGNILLGEALNPVAIDMDINIGFGSMEGKENVRQVQRGFSGLLNNMKAGNYESIIAGVLLALHEGAHEEEEPFTGALATHPQAHEWITAGINQVLDNVKQLTAGQLESVYETWQDKSEGYKEVLQEVFTMLRE